jgi:Polymer-forming cytoskeletal
MNHPNNHQKYGQPGMTSLGQAMPDVLKTPVLTQIETLEVTEAETDTTSASSVAVAVKTGKLCMIEEGITFTGNVALQGTCTIGDIFSHKVSVMGTCSGTIDASGGSVDLHAKSVVSGHIRYGQLQVNGADLNATLERVAKTTA